MLRRQTSENWYALVDALIRNQVSNVVEIVEQGLYPYNTCLLYTSPSPRDGLLSRMPSSA